MARRSLGVARATRPQPARDDKVLASWNGLALLALAEAGAILPEGDRYTRLASEVARSLHHRPRTPDGRLRRSWKDGRPGPAAVLEDHTHLAAGLLALYQATFDERAVEFAVTFELSPPSWEPPPRSGTDPYAPGVEPHARQTDPYAQALSRDTPSQGTDEIPTPPSQPFC